MKAHITLLSFCLILIAGCAKNPATGKDEIVLVSEKQELSIGRQYFNELRKSIILLPENDPLHLYVNHVGQKVAATADRQDLFYRFYVVDDATINAFALPGGYICIHRGLINHLNNEAELAAVLGHEIGHVTARHAVQQITKAEAYKYSLLAASIRFGGLPQGITMLTDLLATAIIRGYGREAEFQSDELSIRYLTRAGYDPKATVGILKTLKRLSEIDTKERTDAGEKVEKYHGAFSTHPETHKRIEQAIGEASTITSNGGIVNRNALLSAVDGYAYGDSSEQGAVVGRRFLHPELGIQLEFPKEWVIKNTPQALTARVRKQDVYMQLQVKELQKKRSAEEVGRLLFTDRHIQKVEKNYQHGMEHARLVVKESAPKVSQAMIDSHVFLRGSKAFILSMWSKRDEYRQYEKDFLSISSSFSSYDIKRDGDIPRIAIYKWRSSDSWEKLARANKNILGRFTAEKLAALNGMGLDEKPEVGALIKTVH